MIVGCPLEAEEGLAQPKDAASAAAQLKAMAMRVRRLIGASRNRLGAAELRSARRTAWVRGEG
jgi:hypothetical protein